jgi:lysophospholipase L1-like esterase
MRPHLFRTATRIVFVLLLLWIGLTPIAADEKRDLARMVVVGDSLAAGFQNFSLLHSQQVFSAPALIAQQARVPLELPLVPDPGVPNVLTLVSVGPPPIVQPTPGPGPAFPRLNPLTQATNLAVPGHTVQDAINKRPGSLDALTDIVLGFPTPFVVPGVPRSQLETAVALDPSFVLLWIGNNDALFAAISGDLSSLTPADQFAASYASLSSTLATTGATMVFVNLTDVTSAPYFTTLATLSEQTGIPQSQVATLLNVQVGDTLRPGALPIAHAILGGQLPGPLPLLCPSGIPGVSAQLPCAMTAGVAAFIRGRLQVYNQVIAEEAALHGAALVDLESLFRDITIDGYDVAGRHLTTAFLGGLFSLDGLHPTNTANAIIANEILEQMKRQLHIGVPKVNVVRVAADDPLVPAK